MQEVNELKQAISDSLILGVNRKRAFEDLSTLEPIGNDNSKKEPSEDADDSTSKEAEVQSLPLLSIIDKSAHPIQHIYNLWASGDEDVHKHRALKDICKQPRDGLIRWKNRSIQNIVGKIR